MTLIESALVGGSAAESACGRQKGQSLKCCACGEDGEEESPAGIAIAWARAPSVEQISVSR